MVKQTVHALLLACVLSWMPNLAWAQDANPDTAQDPSAGFTGAAADLQKRLEDSLAELAALRKFRNKR